MYRKNPLITKDNAAQAVKATFEDFVIPVTVYDFPRQEKVPSGYYFSEIIDIHPCVSSKGKKCLDVIYQLWGFHEKLGDHIIRLRYPEGSQPLHDLYKAMLNAGVAPGPNMRDAIGVTEKINLIYEDSDGIGSIYQRVYDPPQEDDSDEGECEESETEEDEE